MSELNRIMSKERILRASAVDGGFYIQDDKTDDCHMQLRARLKIFVLQGYLTVERRKDRIHYRLKKETYLL